jgi:uncharacterized protein DUF3300
MPLVNKAVAALLICFLVVTVVPTRSQTAPASGTQASGESAPPPGPQDEYAPLSADELDALVAPIALYPDALVAQVLGASTFPYEIVAATLWTKENSSLTGQTLAKAVDQQSWDPAVKALTQFPTVLDNLAKNLAWTSALGEASATQQQDVMAAVQRMRAKAYAAGNLKSGPEIKVVQQAPQTIVIQPANPQIVYVPVYSPTVVYGGPIIVPGYYYRGPSAVTVISFGGGIVVGATVYGGCCGWGWSYWGTNWHSHTVIYNRNIYVGNSYWRGGYYGGAYRPPGYHPGYPGYKPGYPGYRPPSYPGYGRPPATTLPANAGSNIRPAGPDNSGGNRPGAGTPSTLPANPGNRPSTRPSAQPNPKPSTQPSTRPTTQPGQRPSTQPTRPDSFSGSAGGRAQSARGNQSMGARGGGGGARRK